MKLTAKSLEDALKTFEEYCSRKAPYRKAIRFHLDEITTTRISSFTATGAE